MKAKERHHLKQNEFASTAARVSTAVVDNRRQIILAVLLVAVVGGAIGGYLFWRASRANAAGAQLGVALSNSQAPIAPPSTLPGAKQAPGTFPSAKARSEAVLKELQAIIAAYPSSDAALTARYEAAGELMSLGRQPEAEQMYREVVASGSPIYSAGARLGLARALAAAGKYDEAIKTLSDLAADRDTIVPVDGVLMQLAETYAKAGKTQDAQATYKRVVDEFPDSTYAAQAKQKVLAN